MCFASVIAAFVSGIGVARNRDALAVGLLNRGPCDNSADETEQCHGNRRGNGDAGQSIVNIDILPEASLDFSMPHVISWRQELVAEEMTRSLNRLF